MAEEVAVAIRSETIALDRFLKWCGAAATGGEAKRLVQSGQTRVNGSPELRRAHALRPGDVVEVPGRGKWRVVSLEAGR